MFVRNLLKKKLNNPEWIVPKRLPHSFVGKDSRVHQRVHELKGLPSIYIPVEVRNTDISGMSFTDFETRWEKDKRIRLMKEVNYDFNL